MNTRRIVVTSGEPAGIGPDLCLQLAHHSTHHQLIILADPELLTQRAQQLNLDIKLPLFDRSKQDNETSVLPVNLNEPVTTGQLNIKNSSYVLRLIKQAVQGCRDGLFDAMVTAPVHKGVINDAGIRFSGHTEFIAELTQSDPVMMLATAGLRVALATTHLPLSNVAQSITSQSLEKVLRILHDDLQSKFNISSPNILVCGLNPHAGEGGHLGHEEIDIIIPLIETLTQEGMNLTGPLPADTLFTPKYLEQADAVLAMYHDQGLPVLKYKGFGQAANITLGLPIVRTSVDHGTALDLAGTGQAHSGSLIYAVDTALEMVNHS